MRLISVNRLDAAIDNLVAATAASRSDPVRRELVRVLSICTVSDRQAAVLIPLFEDPSTGQVHVVLTRRSTGLATHSGEVCLPGGRRDPEDFDDAATAVREAEEELGISPASVRVLGCLPPLLSKHRLSVRPVLAAIPPDLPFVPNPAEVESVFAAPLSMFVEPPVGCHRHKDHAWEEGFPFRVHFFKHAHRGSEYVIWGLTAGILIEAAQIAFARDAAFPVSVPHAPPYASLVFRGGRLAFDAGREDGVMRAWQMGDS
ncbi:hypothetical protein H632_c27p3 [Helicosporidium sp. ATCC 50920]|nr:hypothetical protein H632_c27p3 [Helicosporidium sp. ATCC 50920]|eukprot:KDD77070.1 hypothetical protein H632_c27p3 [Helicosporidium sp. ATCC 50920]